MASLPVNDEFSFSLNNNTIVTKYSKMTLSGDLSGFSCTCLKGKDTTVIPAEGHDHCLEIVVDAFKMAKTLNVEESYSYSNLQEKLNASQGDNFLAALNALFIKEKNVELINCLFHKRFEVRNTAFALLCQKLIITDKTINFFLKAFQFPHSIQPLDIPQAFSANYQDHTQRNITRWLTALKRSTETNKIWNLIKPTELKPRVLDDKTGLEEESMVIRSSPDISNILNWLQKIPSIPPNTSKIVAEDEKEKKSKVFSLRKKWYKSKDKIGTAEKFLNVLIKDIKCEGELQKIYRILFGDMDDADRQVFFIYGTCTKSEEFYSISYKYLTETLILDEAKVNEDKSSAQRTCRAITRAIIYLKENYPTERYTFIKYYEKMLNILNEVNGIFVPSFEIHNPEWAIANLETNKREIGKSPNTHINQNLQNFHFEVKEPKLRFLPYTEIEDTSAHEINSLKGNLIRSKEYMSKISKLPEKYNPAELKFKILFKASGKFDQRRNRIKAPKKIKKKIVEEKIPSLEDVFNTDSTVGSVSIEDLFGASKKENTKKIKPPEFSLEEMLKNQDDDDEEKISF